MRFGHRIIFLESLIGPILKVGTIHPGHSKLMAGVTFCRPQMYLVMGDGCNWDVASSPRQYHLQKLLWQRDDLIMSSLGRWGVMRPSGYNSQWKTESNWLHWDHNPWTKPGFSHVQAIICLTDSTPTSGGFACVRGFHKKFRHGAKHIPWDLWL